MQVSRSSRVYPTTVALPVVPDEAWTRTTCSRGTANSTVSGSSRRDRPFKPYTVASDTAIMNRIGRPLAAAWARDPVLTREGYDALQTILLDAGFIKRPHRFEDLVDVEIAREAAS